MKPERRGRIATHSLILGLLAVNHAWLYVFSVCIYYYIAFCDLQDFVL